jgi:hypothetical protein
VEARERLVGIARPGRGECLGEVVLLGEQLGRPVAHPAWLDQHDLGVVRQHVGEQLVLVDQPRQPRLHSVEVVALGKPLPLLASPRLGGDQLVGSTGDIFRRGQLAGGEDDDVVEVDGRALVVDAETRQPVHLVAPQIDADRRVGGRWVDVDDRAPPSEFSPVLDQPFAPVAEADECLGELVGIDDRIRPDHDRLGGRRSRSQLLEQGAHAGDDDRRSLVWVAQPPQHLEPLPHRLDTGAHALERQRLPRREVDDLTIGHELGEVVVELAGTGTGRAGDDEWTPARQLGQRRDRHRSRHLHDGDLRRGITERARQPRLVAQQWGQFRQHETEETEPIDSPEEVGRHEFWRRFGIAPVG